MTNLLRSPIPAVANGLRFDLPRNAYAPSPRVLKLLHRGGFEDPGGSLLHQRIADHHQIEPGRISLADSIATLVDVVNAHYGSADQFSAASDGLDQDGGGPVCLATPDHVFGKTVNVQTIVSLATTRPLVLIDERHSGYSTRSHLSIASEFDNVIVLRSFENWAGLDGDKGVAYAILPNRLSVGLLRDLSDIPPTPTASAAAITALADSRYHKAATRKVVANRIELFRMLRKLNTVVPERSGANFIGCRVIRGSRDECVAFLRARSIHVYVPEHGQDDNVIRFTALPEAATISLKEAMLEWSHGLDDEIAQSMPSARR